MTIVIITNVIQFLLETHEVMMMTASEELKILQLSQLPIIVIIMIITIISIIIITPPQ